MSVIRRATVADAGPEGYVLNVFTESQCRRQGVAESLMRALIAWATTRGFTGLLSTRRRRVVRFTRSSASSPRTR